MRVAYIQPTNIDHVASLCMEYATLIQHKGDAGLDLFTTSIHHLGHTGEGDKINLGFAMVIVDKVDMEPAVPIAWMLMPRSSTPSKYGIIQTNSIGIIDAGYRGGISVPILPFDISRETTILPFTRLFQAVPFDGKGVDLVQVVAEDLNDMFPSSRGIGGFGSTGH